jgi:hypothetical protein
MGNLTRIQLRNQRFFRPYYKAHTSPSSKLGDYIDTMHLLVHLIITFLRRFILDPSTICLRHLLSGSETKWAHFTLRWICLFWSLRFVQPAYISFQKYKWAHFTRNEIFFFFPRAPYILRITYFSGNNGGQLYFKLVGRLQQLFRWCFDLSETSRTQSSLFREGQDGVSHYNT